MARAIELRPTGAGLGDGAWRASVHRSMLRVVGVDEGRARILAADVCRTATPSSFVGPWPWERRDLVEALVAEVPDDWLGGSVWVASGSLHWTQIGGPGSEAAAPGGVVLA